MDEKIITLTDGTKLEVKVNFMTLYLIQKHGLDKVINKEALSEDENMEAAAKLIYIILRSNGLKVDEDEALILTPMDPEAIRELFDEFGKQVDKYKKKRSHKKESATDQEEEKEEIEINWAEYMVAARMMGMSENEFFNSDPIFFNECLEVWQEVEKKKVGVIYGRQ